VKRKKSETLKRWLSNGSARTHNVCHLFYRSETAVTKPEFLLFENLKSKQNDVEIIANFSAHAEFPKYSGCFSRLADPLTQGGLTRARVNF